MMIKWLFITNQVLPYVEGTIPCPNPDIDPVGTRNWIQNDAYTCSIISANVDSSQRKHIKRCDTSCDMWKALKAVNESRGHQTVINYIRTLFRCTAEEDADIPRHLDLIKETWERINILGSEHFQISDLFFKIIIASSLPPSWDPFTENYIGNETSFLQVDPKWQMSSQEFIGVIMAEYARHESRRHGTLKLHHTGTPQTIHNAPPLKTKSPFSITSLNVSAHLKQKKMKYPAGFARRLLTKLMTALIRTTSNANIFTNQDTAKTITGTNIKRSGLTI